VKTDLADIDGSDTGIGLAKRVGGSLGRTAAGDQDLEIGALSFGRPKKMEQRPAVQRIFVKFTMLVEIRNRWRVRVPFVKGAYLSGYISRYCSFCAVPIHVTSDRVLRGCSSAKSRIYIRSQCKFGIAEIRAGRMELSPAGCAALVLWSGPIIMSYSRSWQAL
jgi:hypothetical protein